MSEKKNDITTETSTTPRPVEVFYSYAHADEDFRVELVKHLRLLERQKVITGWHDRNISAGTEWKDAIDEHLESAGIILLLISADFLASDYCYDIELKRAMERHAEGTARVIPIILRKCDWSYAPFGKLQALPKNATPLKNWADQDEAFTDIVTGIKRAIAEIVPSPEVEPATEEDLNALSKQAFEHYDLLESIEAKEILERLSKDHPTYKHRDWELSPAQFLKQEMPDYRRSVLLVVGHLFHAQLNDGPLAIWLKQEIDCRGQAERLEVAYVVTDRGLSENTLYRKCPLIAIGGPNVNSLTAELKDNLKTDLLISNQGALIQHDIESQSRQVALWGRLHDDTSRAVRLFVSSGLLDRYLKMIRKA